MAISFVKDFTGSDGAAVAIVATVPAAGVAAGNTLVLEYAMSRNDITFGTVVDSKGNSYTVHETINDSSAVLTLAVMSGRVSSALVSGDTVTVNLATGGGGALICSEFTGLAAFDQKKSALTTFDVTHTTGNTPVTSQADELLFGAASWRDSAITWTATGGFAETEQASFFADWRQVCQYRVVSATGAYASTGTTSGADSLNQIIATFRADTGTAATVMQPRHGLGAGRW